MLLHHDDDQPALVDAATGGVTTYAALRALITAECERLGRERALVFLFADNTVSTVVSYLAALEQGHAVALLDTGARPATAESLISTYRPEAVVHPFLPELRLSGEYLRAGAGLARRRGPAWPMHPDLAVLLTTSGSTGSPKLVRLSRRNLLANAAAIASSLDLDRPDRAVTSLPLHYSYGMSVLNSHLLVGSSLLVTDAAVLEPRFWEAVGAHRVTFLAGVPFTYQALLRVGFESMELPALHALTQAGGKLAEPMVVTLSRVLRARGGRFYVMYGQTEASPRMTCLPPDRLPEKLGSVGVPLAGGSVLVRTGDGEPAGPGVTGDVFYQGPNVMMGYAERREDLALGDLQGDTLETGDIGHLDEDGYLFVTGRTKRIGKLFGVRLSLDEVEQMLRREGPVAVVESSADRLTIFCEWGDDQRFDTERVRLARDLRVPARALRFVRLDALPVLPSGKTDYRALTAEALA